VFHEPFCQVAMSYVHVLIFYVRCFNIVSAVLQLYQLVKMACYGTTNLHKICFKLSKTAAEAHKMLKKHLVIMPWA
jgi:hypothetical protein